MKLSVEAWKTIRWVLIVLLICIAVIFVFYAVYLPDEIRIVMDVGENMLEFTDKTLALANQTKVGK